MVTFGPNKGEIVGSQRKLHNEELHNLYSSQNIIRMIKWRIMRWVGACSTHGKKRNAYKIFVGKSEGKRPLEIIRRRWEDNIKICLSEIWWGSMDWIDLAQDRDQWRALVNTVMNLRVPWNIVNLLSSWVTGGFPRTQYREVSSLVG
jgi:hypothetical protein